MPNYSLPQFNLLTNIYQTDTSPDDVGYTPDWTNVPAQKYIQKWVQGSWNVINWVNGLLVCEWRFPRTVQPFDDTVQALYEISYVGVAGDDGLFWRIHGGDFRHQGFTNEYAVLIGHACDPFGFPMRSKTHTFDGYTAAALEQNLGDPN